MALMQSANLTATGTIVSQPCRVTGIHFVSSGTAGSISLKDGGSGGTELVKLDTPGVAEGDDITVPGDGIEFKTDVHATLTNVDGLTIFYN